MQGELQVARKLISRLATESEQASADGRAEGEEQASQALQLARSGAAQEQQRLMDQLHAERVEVCLQSAI